MLQCRIFLDFLHCSIHIFVINTPPRIGEFGDEQWLKQHKHLISRST